VRRVAYDQGLAHRIRTLLQGESVTEKTMFGGLAFLVGGNMSVAASGQGGLLVRCDPAETEALLREPGVELMEMRGRTMAGWLRVDAGVLDDAALRTWVDRGVSYAASLPPK
jgi:TfoX/Sxy family transcriptional regulator of competence genes